MGWDDEIHDNYGMLFKSVTILVTDDICGGIGFCA
jgi:hypothetical protein